jgi:hypothetical protein
VSTPAEADAGCILLPYAAPGPKVTPEFVALLEEEAARRGLPPDPWPFPDDLEGDGQ